MAIILTAVIGSLVTALVSVFWYFFMEFYAWTHGQANTIIESVFNSVGLNVNIPWLASTYNTMNYFLPISELLTAIMAVFTVWFLVLSAKITVKLIPTIY